MKYPVQSLTAIEENPIEQIQNHTDNLKPSSDRRERDARTHQSVEHREGETDGVQYRILSSSGNQIRFVRSETTAIEIYNLGLVGGP